MSGHKPWHDDDSFWQALGPVIFSSFRWEQAKADVDYLLRLLELQPASSILDIPCGSGRHALELARRGFAVTGVDRTEAYIEELQIRAAAAGLSIETIQADMRDFARTESFHAVINLFSSFGYFADPKADLRVLRSLHQSLRPGGKLVMDLVGKEVLARTFQERSWFEVDGYFALEERKIVEGWRRVESRWIVVDPQGQKHEHTMKLRLYSAAELCALCEACGFFRVDIYGDLEGAAYDHEATRLVIVAQKEYRIATRDLPAFGHGAIS